LVLPSRDVRIDDKWIGELSGSLLSCPTTDGLCKQPAEARRPAAGATRGMGMDPGARAWGGGGSKYRAHARRRGSTERDFPLAANRAL
jgi:hypothetical protein